MEYYLSFSIFISAGTSRDDLSYNQKESSTNSKGVINCNKEDGGAAMLQVLGSEKILRVWNSSYFYLIIYCFKDVLLKQYWSLSYR